ncbi:MAG TPA: biotin/lipoyl-containing protein, partial [Lichenihabitans sp.]|nr:biotin/lipoyl-containing protein [Lichenihabitans sp.]
MATEIRVPTLGESVSEATIGKWFKQAGDAVKADEPLVELETDKVTLEVNSPSAGVLAEIIVKDGETVGVGALLGQIEPGGAGAKPDGVSRKAAAGGKPASVGAEPAKAEPIKPANAAAPAIAAKGAKATPILAPTLGESVSEATVGRWFKTAGAIVKADEPLLELETDKVTLEVNAPTSGTLAEIAVADGDTVKPGAVLGRIDASAGAAAASRPAPAAPSASSQPRPGMPAAPSAAKIATERGIDLAALEGSG